MPSTPNTFTRGFQRNAYSRVSFGNHRGSYQEQNVELLKGERGGQHGPPPLKPGVDYINPGEEDQMEVYGYRRNVVYSCIAWFFIVCTLGLLRLVFHWRPRWMLYATHSMCNLDVAEKVLIVEHYQQKYQCYFVKNIVLLSSTSRERYATLGSSVRDKLDGDALTELQESSYGNLCLPVGNGLFKEVDAIRMFRCKKMCYVWDGETCEFQKLRGLDYGALTSTLHQHKGLTVTQQLQRRTVYGANEIVVPVKGVVTLLFLEVLNPFYVFQVFSICLWFSDEYYYYAVAIFIMSVFGITSSVIQTRKNQNNLRSTVHSSDVIGVWRPDADGKNGVIEQVPTETLVPGDVIVLPSHGCIMHCDAALLTGTCIVNESMLTGESVPVTKTPLPSSADQLYDQREHARHTLFCGTKVVQTRYYGSARVLAVVLKTGFLTAKGSLVRAILYPPPADFKFEQDSYKFVAMLAGIASIGFLYTVVSKHLRGVSARDIALDALDLITIVVPPALPAAMTVGRLYAQNRLKANNIYCISPRTINVAGSLDCVCFDKTGTLTEDGLDMWGSVPVEKGEFQPPVKNVPELHCQPLLIGMAACHSLTLIDGELTGDPLDLKMFESTGWILEEPEVSDSTKFDMITPTVVKPPKPDIVQSTENVEIEPPFEVGIVRQFPFSSSLQRMSVITRVLGGSHFEVFCKGSPEMIVSLSQSDTVPSNFGSVLEGYTQEGYRVIALGTRSLAKISYARVQRITREEVESNLVFLGLIVLENRLKPETTGVIRTLRDANIRTIMVTGDNILTALSVARDCGIVPHAGDVIVVHAVASQGGLPAQVTFTKSQQNGRITNGKSKESESIVSSSTVENGPRRKYPKFYFAVSGRSWAVVRESFPELLPRLAVRGAVFARMSPDQKQQLVQELQGLGYYVGMCGDGANDCGALKAAHAGISLSEAESSVASPFTSREPNVSCVPQLIREGRAALVTSFGIFKYMAAYSLTQFVSVMILYSRETNLTDVEFLYIDLFLITLFAFFFGKTEAFPGPLTRQPPMTSLLSVTPIVSLFAHMAIVVVVQGLAFYYVQVQPWFTAFAKEPEDDDQSLGCWENYAVFAVSSFQYITLAIVYSKGSPYRRSLVSNKGMLISLVIMTALSVYIVLSPMQWIVDGFELVLPPTYTFRLIMLGFALANFVLSFIVEYFVIDFVVFKKCRTIKKSKRRYLAIEREISRSSDWPPISESVTSAAPMPKPPPQSPSMEVKVDFVSETDVITCIVGKSKDNKHRNGIVTRLEHPTEITLNPSTLLNELPSLKKKRRRGSVEREMTVLNGDVAEQDVENCTVGDASS